MATEIQMPDRQRAASALAYDILVIATDPATPSRHEPILAHRCIECMTGNFSDPSFNINKLAKILNVNRNHLSRSFSAAREVTLTRYLQTLRFQKALSLLSKTTLPVAQIAEDSGFASASYLARCLQKEMGISASEFRKGKEPRF
jgi:transcriptional regulator GlxA family with amidase domain